MELKNMALSKRESKERNVPCEVGSKSEGPRFPYGLEVRLENESIEKLGLTKLPKVGKHMKLMAEVTVTSVSSNEHQRGKLNRSVSLQIEKLALSSAPSSMEDALDDGIEQVS